MYIALVSKSYKIGSDTNFIGLTYQRDIQNSLLGSR